MEQKQTQEPWEELEQKSQQRKMPKRIRLTIAVPEFLRHIGEDVKWYYDVRLWSPVILLLLILALVIPVRKAEPAPAEVAVPETVAAETVPVVTEPEPEPIDPNAAALAVLADSVGSGRSDNVKTIIMWVAINRSEDRANGYGGTLQEEIDRPSQWQGYDENVTYSESTYEIAKEVLKIQAEGKLRPLDSDMLWLVLNDNGSVTVRNQFTATATQKWHEKTVR